MDNPQPKVSESEYGWLAGFFDGEGTVALGIRASDGKNGSPKVQPLAMLSGTDIVGLNKAVEVFEKADIAHHVAWFQPKGYMRNGNSYKQAWSIVIAGHKRCRRFYRMITPYLHVKRERAELMLDYLSAREAHTDFRTPITEREFAIALRMKQLNMKGGKAQPFTKAVTLNTERPGASSGTLAANGLKGAQARWGIRN